MIARETVAADDVRYLLRIPSRLYAIITRLAREDTRSIHGQIIHLLRQAIIARGEDPDAE